MSFSFSQKQDKPINALTIKPHLELVVVTCQVINQISTCLSFHQRADNFTYVSIAHVKSSVEM